MDEDDFKQAIRLLHVCRAWMGVPMSAPDPAKLDPLYPMLHAGRQAPVLGVLNELLAKYPYEPVVSPEALPEQRPPSGPTHPLLHP